MVRRLNIDGDRQGDLAGHGGEHRAVFVYQIEPRFMMSPRLRATMPGSTARVTYIRPLTLVSTVQRQHL